MRQQTDFELSLKDKAREIGFDLVGITPAVVPPGYPDFLAWIENRYHGEMEYMERRKAAFEHPRHVLKTVRSVIMLGMNYGWTESPRPTRPGQARISRYAWGSVDYHDVIRARLRQLADWLHQQRPGSRTRGVVDTAPLLERDFAQLAGLGWIGKNTLLLNKYRGSWFFLAGLLTDLELEPDEPHQNSHCGTCTRCLDECPTNAFPEPGVLDARKCISYLTIELRHQPVPKGLRAGMRDWLFGCDVCQDVCPWNTKPDRNRQSSPVGESGFFPKRGQNPIDAGELLGLTEQDFQARFKKTPLLRSKRAGLLRNAAIVLGNQKHAESVPSLIERLADEEPLIRGACAWALGQIGGERVLDALTSRAAIETDKLVEIELKQAIVHCKQLATRAE